MSEQTIGGRTNEPDSTPREERMQVISVTPSGDKTNDLRMAQIGGNTGQRDYADTGCKEWRPEVHGSSQVALECLRHGQDPDVQRPGQRFSRFRNLLSSKNLQLICILLANLGRRVTL